MRIFAKFDMKGGEAMCCANVSHHECHRSGPKNACFCGCDDPGSYKPRFMTKKQRIANLEKHLNVLQDEAKAVEEHIAQIKKEK
jgi:hypothetical protein